MTRQEYRECRKLIKDNGRYALRWLTPEQSNTFEELLYVQDSTDRLAERASIVNWCNRENVSYNFRHLR
jgi:hypothetical protein